MNTDQKLAVVAVPLEEWEAYKAMLKEATGMLKAMCRKDEKELLTTKEVCEMLKISRATYDRHVNDGLIIPVQVNKKKYSRHLIRRADIEQLIDKGKF